MKKENKSFIQSGEFRRYRAGQFRENRSGLLGKYRAGHFRKKRTSRYMRYRSGSVTVETTMVLPLFLVFSMMLFSLFEILFLYGRMQSALTETAIETATFLYVIGEENEGKDAGGEKNIAVEELTEEKATGNEALSEEISLLISETFIREEIIRKVGLSELNQSVIEGDALGLHLYRSDVAEDGKKVNLILTYRVKPWFSFGGIGSMTLVNHASVNVWRGYTKEGSGEETQEEKETVYVTKTGTAYHLYRDCSYLMADAKAVFGGELGIVRNESGGKYYPCEICCKEGVVSDGKLYYISTWGNRYHTERNCRAIVKDAEAIPADETGSRHLCSKCALRKGVE